VLTQTQEASVKEHSVELSAQVRIQGEMLEVGRGLLEVSVGGGLALDEESEGGTESLWA